MTKHHDIKASDPLPALRLVSNELPSDPDSPYGAEEERQRRRREREQDELDAMTFGRKPGEPALRGLEPIGNLTPAVIESGIIGMMALEKCDRETAIAIINAPVPKAKPETPEERKARHVAEERARLRAWFAASGIPITPEMAERVVCTEHLRTEATRAAALWFRDPTRRILVLLGPMGVGKTVAASLVAATYARQRQTVRYLREPKLVKWVGGSTLAHETRVEELSEADLLIVDELGTTLSNQGEKARDAMFALLDDRIGTETRTILMGNLTAKDPATGATRGSAAALAKAYGGRFVDRLREVGRIVELGGESMRGRS
jgi:DNA replication protein DnaC